MDVTVQEILDYFAPNEIDKLESILTAASFNSGGTIDNFIKSLSVYVRLSYKVDVVLAALGVDLTDLNRLKIGHAAVTRPKRGYEFSQNEESSSLLVPR